MTSQQQQDEVRQVVIDFEWKQLIKVPVATPYSSYPVYTESYEPHKCTLNVFVQGNLERILEGMTVFMAVHDIGKNHNSFVKFVNSEPMRAIKQRAVFLHICVPGQEANAQDFKDDYPSMDNLGDALTIVMKKMNLKKCVVIGEGAGADIACRFAMNHRKYVTGLVLIHCTSTTHGIIENIKEIFTNLILEDGEMTHSSWNYLLTHRYGNHKMDEVQKKYIEDIKTEERINLFNLSRYIYSFANRSDFTHELKESLSNKVDVLLITGGRSSHNDNVQHMFAHMNKEKTGMLVAEGSLDILEEAPDYLSSALVLLCSRKNMLSDIHLAVDKTNYAPNLFVGKPADQEEKPTAFVPATTTQQAPQ